MSSIKYIGSSCLGLQKLEHNHREATRIEGYTISVFRKALEEKHKGEGKFRWLVSPALRTEKEILELEKKCINNHVPEYNQQYDPVGIKKGIFDNNPRYRGVYCFEV